MFTNCATFEEALESGVKLQKHLSNDLKAKHKHLNCGLNGGLVSSVTDVTDVMKVLLCANALFLDTHYHFTCFFLRW